MNSYIENSEESTDILFKIKELIKVNGYKISSRKSTAFLYTTNSQLENVNFLEVSCINKSINNKK